MKDTSIGVLGSSVDTQCMPRCRARTEDGTGRLCKRRVHKEGERCYLHRGLPTAPPRKARSKARSHAKPPPTPRSSARQWKKDRDRVKKAAEYCSDVLTDGWQEAVAARATDYVSDQTWKRLFNSSKRNCKSLAGLAKKILAGKEKLHKLVGGIVAWILSLLGINEAARKFAGELASRIPIQPLDLKAVAVARGVQIAGIALCVSSGDDLTKCQCFIDLALAETKTRVKKLLVAATQDWVRFKELEPRQPHATTRNR
jgi:hypothetical protein